MARKKTYDESSIRALDFPENVRTSPSMYVGTTDSAGITHCFREIFDNATDEARESGSKDIYVEVTDSYLFVMDTGRGIPVGASKDVKGQSTLTTIFTHLHAGGKTVQTGAYQSARGCFTGDTKIKLLDGTSVPIEELARDYEKTKKKHWVYSFSKKAEKLGYAFVPREAYAVFATRMAKELAIVELDNGEKIKCTIDHPFMLWDGTYVKAANLKEGTSLRAVHFKEDKDGYLTHSAAHKITKPVTRFENYVHRTVAKIQGIKEDGKQVSHKNADKKDNRPENLQSLSNKEHWRFDHKNHEKNKSWTRKTKKDRLRSRKNMKSVNKTLDKTDIQKGRYIQVAARALRDYGRLSEETFNASRGWCYPKYNKAISVFSEKTLTRLARNYLKRYGKDGRTDNGGNGLNYRLESEYEKSPAYNYNNHTVKSVKIKKLKKPVQVYGMSVDTDHNYLLDAGVFVANTHGVGASVVNALADKMTVWSNRDKKWHSQSFVKGIAKTKVEKSKQPETSLSKNPEFSKLVKKAGTAVIFRPDPEIFKKNTIDQKAIREVVRSASYFLPGVTFTLLIGKKVEKFKTRGLIDLIPDLAKDNKVEVASDIFSYSTPSCAIAIAWSDSPEEICRSYVSGGLSEFGGTHQKALDKLFIDCMSEIGGRNAKKVKPKFFKSGLISVVDVSISHPTFDSQTKSRLTSKEAADKVAGAKPAFLKFLKEHKKTVQEVIERALRMQEAENQFKVSAAAASKLKSPRGKVMLPAKLVVSSTKKPEDRELFILEGDSAGGTAKAARDPLYQEVLPLRGKFTNPFKEKDEKVFSNDSVLSIFQSIGYNPSNRDDPLADMRVGRVLFLSDADEDGFHINSLLAALFTKYMPQLFDRKAVYVVKAPLYRGVYKDQEFYGMTIKEVEKTAGRKGLTITRFKGWGESSSESLKKIAFDPSSRALTRLKPLTSEQVRQVERIMGEETATRRELLGIDVG